MSGRKTFVGGDILLASELNGFLMDQSVMVFDDAAARTTAIPSPSEGMVTYLTDVDALQVWTGSAWIAAASGASLAPGTVLQVVQTVKTDSFSTTSTSLVDVTGFSVTITPRAASSRILVIADIAMGHSQTNVDARFSLVRDSTLIYVTGGNDTAFFGHVTSTATLVTATKVFADSPNTTSAITYKGQIRTASGTTHFNRRGVDAGGGATSITAIEVAG